MLLITSLGAYGQSKKYFGFAYAGAEQFLIRGSTMTLGISQPIRSSILEWGGYFQYLPASTEEGKAEFFNVTLMMRANLFEKKKFYIGLGPTFQHLDHRVIVFDDLSFSAFTMAYQIGYEISITKKLVMIPELFFSGPTSGNIFNFGKYI